MADSNIKKGKIGNALESVAPEHVVAVANDIYDETLGKYQSELNQQIGHGGYTPPQGGIPKSDLSSDVQASLGKADAAVPNTRTVNGKALSSNITLNASDVGALPSSTTIPTTLSQLSDDSTHRTVTDSEKTNWNDKYTKTEVDNMLVSAPEANVVVIENPSGADPTTLLPSTPAANTIYRVKSADGTYFSEYEHNGTKYVNLADRQYGIDDEPVDKSNNMAKSGGIFRMLSEKVSCDSVNLYKLDEFILNYYLTGSGYEHADENNQHAISNYIPVKEQSITLDCNISLYAAICVYDKDKNFLRSITPENIQTKYTYTYQSGDYYIRATVKKDRFNTVMANYGNTLKSFVPYNPIDRYLPKLPVFSVSVQNHFNRFIKELYLADFDNSKYYYIYTLGSYIENGATKYSLYIGVSNTEKISTPATIAAYYDSPERPEGIIALSGNNGSYAVLDFNGIDSVSDNILNFGRKTLLNKTIIRSLDFNPRINGYLNPSDISVDISDCTISLYREGAIVFFNRIVTSQSTSGYNIYKLEGEAIDQKKDIIFRNYNLRGATVQFVTAWDSTDRFLCSFATVNEDTTPLQDDGWYDIIAKTSQYKNIAYLLFVVYSARMPDISTKIYNNLSFLPEEDEGNETIHVSKDGSGDYTKISDAINYANNKANTIIMVDAGEYDLIEELGADYFANMENVYYQGLKLGNNTVIRATGNGVTIKAIYTGDNVYVGYQFSLININGSCKVENINFVAQNTRYVIHDDLPVATYPEISNYRVEFIDCTFNHKGSTMYDSSQSLPISVGGGCTKNSMHRFDGCTFKSEANVTATDISYHNSSLSKSKVLLKNCYFINGKTFASRAASLDGGTIDVYLCGNRFGASLDIRNPEKIIATEFNNSFA